MSEVPLDMGEDGLQGFTFVLSRSKDQHSSGIGIAVKIMTDSKQHNSYILGRKWRNLVPTVGMVSVE